MLKHCRAPSGPLQKDTHMQNHIQTSSTHKRQVHVKASLPVREDRLQPTKYIKTAQSEKTGISNQDYNPSSSHWELSLKEYIQHIDA